MPTDEKLHQLGVDASEALRAAADVLVDSSIPVERRIEAYRRCMDQHAKLASKFAQASEKYVTSQSATRS
jgi:hypothetical protein